MRLFKWMRQKMKNNRGISLLEGVFTTGILSFGLLASMTAVQGVNSTQTTSREGVVSSQLANEKLEMILADNIHYGYNHINGSNYPLEHMSGFYNGYARRVIIFEVNPVNLGQHQTGTGLKKVHVQVEWGSTGNVVNVESLISRF